MIDLLSAIINTSDVSIRLGFWNEFFNLVRLSLNFSPLLPKYNICKPVNITYGRVESGLYFLQVATDWLIQKRIRMDSE